MSSSGACALESGTSQILCMCCSSSCTLSGGGWAREPAPSARGLAREVWLTRCVATACACLHISRWLSSHSQWYAWGHTPQDGHASRHGEHAAPLLTWYSSPSPAGTRNTPCSIWTTSGARHLMVQAEDPRPRVTAPPTQKFPAAPLGALVMIHVLFSPISITSLSCSLPSDPYLIWAHLWPEVTGGSRGRGRNLGALPGAGRGHTI